MRDIVTPTRAFGRGDQKPILILEAGQWVVPIIYRDDMVVVVNKPAGLAMYNLHGSSQPSVVDAVRPLVDDINEERPGIVHRLDRETSGVLIIARKPSARQFLQAEFAERRVEKKYLALVWGHLKSPAARLDLPIRRSLQSPTRMQIHPSGKSALSSYRVIREVGPYSLLEVAIHTGRTHQIRVQLAYLGHPVVADIIYGKKTRPRGLNRQFLHAAELKITLPDGKSGDFSAPLPTELTTFLENVV